MKNVNYNYLMECFSVQNETEMLMIVNERIDNLLKGKADKRFALESLICLFEAKTSVGAYFSAVAIAYAVFIGGVTLLPEEWITSVVAIILILTSLSLCVLALRSHKHEVHRAFILCALRMKYEEVKHSSNTELNKGRVIKEDKDYREYIIRVIEGQR